MCYPLDTRQGTFLSHWVFVQKWHLEWRYLYHFRSQSCQPLVPNRLIFKKNLHWVWKLIHRAWIIRKKHSFTHQGHFVMPAFYPVLIEKTCKCSLPFIIRNIYTWDQQGMCHFLCQTRLFMSYSLLLKQIFTIRDTFFNGKNFFVAKLLYCSLNISYVQYCSMNINMCANFFGDWDKKTVIWASEYQLDLL